MKDEERKEEMVRRIVESRYPDFYKIESDEEFSISDLDDYRRFCDHSLLNDKASWIKIHRNHTQGAYQGCRFNPVQQRGKRGVESQD